MKCYNDLDIFAIFVEILYRLHKGHITEFIRKVHLAYFMFLLETKIRPGYHTKFVHCALKLSQNSLEANQNLEYQ